MTIQHRQAPVLYETDFDTWTVKRTGMNRYITIDVGGTAIKYGLIDEDAHLCLKARTATEAEKGGPHILSKVLKIIETISKDNPDVRGVCVSSTGMIDIHTGSIFNANGTIPGLIGINYKKAVEDRFHLPCEVENDVNCAGLSESLLGSARGYESVLCMTIGTGIGGCFIYKGQVYHGHTGSACEIGYMNMDGTAFENLGSTQALIRKVNSRKNHNTDGQQNRYNTYNGKAIFEAARNGDRISIEAIDEMCDILGRGIANICYILNPAIVVLGGGIMAQTEYLYPRLRRAMGQYLVSSIASKTELRLAENGNDAGMIGAYLHYCQMQGKARQTTGTNYS